MSDAWSALQARKRANPGAPLVTYLDAGRGERVELSGATVENAAAKIANALRDEFDLDRGSTVRLQLPLHWQRSAWTGGIWTAGCALVFDDATSVELVVMDEQSAIAAPAIDHEVLAVSLHPFGLPITSELPPRVTDATIAVRNQPDAYLFDPPTADLAAVHALGTTWTQDAIWARAGELAQAWGVADGGRLLVTDALDPLDAVTACLALPLVCGGSVLLVAGAFDADHLIDAERITAFAAPRP